METLEKTAKYVVGVKQTEKAVLKNEAQKVYIASDADERIVEKLLELCNENGVFIESAESMSELGKICEIQVGAAAAAMLKVNKGSEN